MWYRRCTPVVVSSDTPYTHTNTAGELYIKPAGGKKKKKRKCIIP